LQAAEKAFENEDWETVISRAYYSAYHATAAVLEARANEVRTRWDHNTLRTSFRDRFARQGFLFTTRQAQDLDYLWEQRLVADYQRRRLRRGDAEKAVTLARALNRAITEII
jgi:uncharacterized protein (UPF0332 family)